MPKRNNRIPSKISSLNNGISGSRSLAKSLDNLMAYYRTKQFDLAENLAVSITKEFPLNFKSWQVLGVILNQTGRYSEALSANQQAVLLNSKNEEIHHNLGVTLQNLDKLPAAEESFRKTIEIKPDHAQAHFNLGNTLYSLGKLIDAEESYRRSIKLVPNYPDSHHNLGITLQKLSRFGEAEKCYKRAIELNANHASAHNNLGLILRNLGRLDEAEASYKKSLSANPDNDIAHNNLGVLLLEMGKFEMAELSFRRAITMKNENTEFMLNLAMLLDDMNKIDDAMQIYEDIIKIDPKNQGLVSRVRLAVLKFLQDDIVSAKKNLSASKQLHEKLLSAYKDDRLYKADKIYQEYILQLLDYHETKTINSEIIEEGVLYVIGESHALSSHGIKFHAMGANWKCTSKLIMGCKQWHLGNSDMNKYKKKFKTILHSIPKSSPVLLAIGEIDCRLDTGILKYNAKYPEKNIEEIVNLTVNNYIRYIGKINNKQHKIIIQGVPCPNVKDDNISRNDALKLMEVIKLFNDQLRNKSIEKGFGFLDVHMLTDRGDGFSNVIWHIDEYHLSPQGILEAWQQYDSS